MGQINEKLIFDFIKQQYRPYDTHEEFNRGFSAYQAGSFHNPHTADSVSARVWDMGAEACMRTPIAERPPHGSERAQFGHSAPTLGV